MNEGVGCDLKHSLCVSTLNAVYSRYIAAGYFLKNDKYCPECTVLMKNSILLSKFGRFFTVIFNSAACEGQIRTHPHILRKASEKHF